MLYAGRCYILVIFMHQEGCEVEAAGDGEELGALVEGHQLPGQEAVLRADRPVLVVVVGQVCLLLVVRK